jgi:hypothetical protein
LGGSNYRDWRWPLPAALLLLAIIIAWRSTPPERLTIWLGDATWAKGVVAFGLFFAEIAILIPFGIIAAKIGLPFGLSVEKVNQDRVGLDQELLAELSQIRQGTDRAFIHIGEVNQLVTDTITKLEALAQRVDRLEGERPDKERPRPTDRMG